MFFWNSLAFSLIQRMLAICSLFMLLLQGARIRSLVGEAGSVAKKKGAEREALQAYLANNDVFDCVPQLPVPQLMAQHMH